MRFVRENRQMANKKLYREDVLQMLFADSDSEGEYLPFGNDDRSSNIRASPGTSCGVAGVNVVIVSIGELLLIASALKAAGRQYRCGQ